MLQPAANPVRKVSTIPRGPALGVTLSTPESDRYGYDANYLRGRIIGALGSMAAEQEVFNVVTTGAENDPPGVCVSDQVSPWAQRRRTRQCAASSDFGDGAVIACSAL